MPSGTLPRALLEASWGDLKARQDAKSRGNAPKGDLGAKNDAPEGSGTFKNHSFPMGKPYFLQKRSFQEQPRTRAPKYPPGGPRGAPGGASGHPGEGENEPEISLRRSWAHPKFFLRPEALQEASREASKSTFWPGRLPEASRARFSTLRGVILDPPGLHFRPSGAPFLRRFFDDV